ncbi:phosphohydrolase [Schumannella soli]|uniref:Phosphohydrolase n=1 Tax=Schumannella soli TaxID=2590779 RepID=A0A506Y2S2_9MICO|nr:phosphohydrolase [Schumannella soli]TPW76282.1 phosphohydrolase [Schumannella soli]
MSDSSGVGAGAGGGDARGSSTLGGPGPLDRWFALRLDETRVWDALAPGPALEVVQTRISSAPQSFLAESISLRALTGDVLAEAPEHVRTTAAAIADGAQRDPASRQGAALALWLWASHELLAPFRPELDVRWAHSSIGALAFRLAPLVEPRRWLADGESREEAARLFLLWSGRTPAGEDAATARARWERRDTIARDAALRELVADEEHRRRVQAALAEKRAAEAAARYSHE